MNLSLIFAALVKGNGQREQEKPLVLDANILIRAVLGTRVPVLLEKMSPTVRFFIPAICMLDASKYLPKLTLMINTRILSNRS